MSKTTKIIAIVGGILIIVAGIYGGKTILTVYTGGEKTKPRVQYSKQDIQLQECEGNGWVCARDAKGNVIKDPKNKTKCKAAEGGKEKCVQLYLKKCKDANYKKANKTTCAQAAKKAAKMKKDDDDDDDGE